MDEIERRVDETRQAIERHQQQIHLTDMNVLPSRRIGDETRQAYLYRLIDAYSQGFLTETEFEARKTWVEQAQTHEQANLAFKDLGALRLTQLQLTDTQRQGKFTSLDYSLFFLLIILLGGVLFTGPLAVWFVIAEMIVGYTLLRRIEKK